MKKLRQKGTAVIQDDLKVLFAEIQAAFFAGDLRLLHMYFQFPLVVYTAAGVAVLRSEAEFEAMTQTYLDALKATSATHSRQTILTRDPMVHNRQRVTVRTDDLNAAGRTVTSSTVRFFLVRKDGRYLVEMLEYLEAPLPISDVEKIIH